LRPRAQAAEEGEGGYGRGVRLCERAQGGVRERKGECERVQEGVRGAELAYGPFFV